MKETLTNYLNNYALTPAQSLEALPSRTNSHPATNYETLVLDGRFYWSPKVGLPKTYLPSRSSPLCRQPMAALSDMPPTAT